MNQEEQTPVTAEAAVMDALLERIHRPDAEAREQRVNKALSATVLANRTRGLTPIRSWSSMRWMKFSAAALLFFSVFLWQGEGSPTALGVVARSAEAMRSLTDRQYAVTVHLQGIESRTLKGDLTLRGNDRLAIRLATLAGDIWMGEGADHAWVIPPNQFLPVIQRARGSTFGDSLPGADGTRLPSLEIATMLERLHENYDLSKPSVAGGLTTIRATLRADAAKVDAPALVAFQSEADGTVRHLQMQWPEARPLQPREVQLTLVNSKPVADEFFEHATHHDDGRSVIDRR